MEGHTSKCSPVFGNEFRQTVVELLGAAERAKVTILASDWSQLVT